MHQPAIYRGSAYYHPTPYHPSYHALQFQKYRVHQLFLEYFQVGWWGGWGLNIVFEFICFPNQILFSVCRCQNINKGACSANYSATGDKQSNHYQQSFRWKARTGGNKVMQNQKKQGVSKDLDF
jgi:hypothetical protein